MSNVSLREINKYLNDNEMYFGAENINAVRTLLRHANKPISELDGLKLKSPKTATVLALCFGWLGVDRFYAGDYIHGTVKLLTLGICFLDWLLDMLVIGKRIKAKNVQILYKRLTGVDMDVSVKLNRETVNKLINNEEVRKKIKDTVSMLKSKCQ